MIFIDQLEIAYMRSANVGYEKTGNTNINRFFKCCKKFELTDRLSAYGLAGIGYQDVLKNWIRPSRLCIFNYGVGLRYDIPYYGIAIKR